jgi:hypothetical protein
VNVRDRGYLRLAGSNAFSFVFQFLSPLPGLPVDVWPMLIAIQQWRELNDRHSTASGHGFLFGA